MAEVCTYWTGGAYCGAPASGRYLVGWRCPDCTPAVLAGRAEPTPDPVTWRRDHPPVVRPPYPYGGAQDDPLGRTVHVKATGLLKRGDDDPGPDRAPWKLEEARRGKA